MERMTNGVNKKWESRSDNEKEDIDLQYIGWVIAGAPLGLLNTTDPRRSDFSFVP